jgi:hypothetical protein
MPTLKKKYRFHALWSGEDLEYVGVCEEFPSLSWLAKTRTAALHGIRKLISGITKGGRGPGRRLPPPLAA